MKMRNFRINHSLPRSSSGQKAETAPLMYTPKNRTVTKHSVILSIISLILIGDLLTLNGWAAAHELGFIALITAVTIPGYLSLKLLSGKHKLEAWAEAALSVCLSIGILMLAGLFINAMLPLFGNSHPLGHLPTLITVNVTYAILVAATAIRKSTDLTLSVSSRVIPYTLGAIVLPVAATIGALYLNNGGSNVISIIVILAVCAGGFVTLLRVPEKMYPLVLYSMATAVLMLWSLRSYHVAGSDIGREYFVFNLAYSNARWSIAWFRDAYNACLSITILPAMLARLSHIGGEFVYKVWYPPMFALTAPMAFQYFKAKRGARVAFLATFFMITQSVFIYWLPMLARQEIAMLFFGGMLLVMYGMPEMNTRLKNGLFVLLFIFLALAHYSTAYIVLFVFGFSTVGQLVIKHRKKATEQAKTAQTFPSITLLLMMFLFTFLWQIQITATGQGIVSVLGNTIRQIVTPESGTDKNVSTYKVFSANPFNGSTTNSLVAFSNYQSGAEQTWKNNTGDYYADADNAMGGIAQANPRQITASSGMIGSSVHLFNAVVSIVVRLALVIGIIYLVLKRKQYDRSYVLLSTGFLVLIAAFVAFPYLSTTYNVERLYQVGLMTLAVAVISGLFIIFGKLKRSLIIELVALVVCASFFLYNSGVLTQLGGGVPSAVLNNYGENYDETYVTDADYRAITWLGTQDTTQTAVFCDQIWVTNYSNITNIRRTLLPTEITKNSYVFLSHANNVDNMAVLSYQGSAFLYTPPKAFLNANKNKIYASGSDAIYR